MQHFRSQPHKYENNYVNILQWQRFRFLAAAMEIIMFKITEVKYVYLLGFHNFRIQNFTENTGPSSPARVRAN
jgi:hypothetical protein